MAEALRLDDTLAHIGGIPLEQPLDARLTEAAELLRGYLTRMGAVAGALHATGGLRRDTDQRPPEGAREQALTVTGEALAALFEPERDRLRRTPEQLGITFQYLMMAGSHVPPDELVDLFLHGALQSPDSLTHR